VRRAIAELDDFKPKRFLLRRSGCAHQTARRE